MSAPKKAIRFKTVWLTALIIAVMLAVVAASTVVYAYFSTRVYVYTSDGDRQVAKLGMRLNLLFDRIIPYNENHDTHDGEVTAGTSLGIIKSIDAEGNVTYYEYDPSAEWGTAENPYLISEVRHLHNLSALQSIGYFEDLYIKYNYEDEDVNGTYLETAVMPYFLVCKSDGTPATVDGTGFTISPIGTDEYPFIGYVGGAFAEGTTTVGGLDSDTSAIYNLQVTARDDRCDVGLFGTVGYLGTEPDENAADQTFVGAVSIIRDLLLFDVQVKVTDHTWLEDLTHRFMHDAGDNDVSHENHHIGILVGHLEYASIEYISVYYSSDQIAAIDLSHTTAGSTSSTTPNYLSSSGILGFIYNLNPNLVIDENGVYNVSGSSGKSSEYVHAIGDGNDWGGSIDMEKMYTHVSGVYTAASFATYPSAVTVTIDANGNEISRVTTATSNITQNSTRYKNVAWDDNSTSMYSFYESNSEDFRYIYGYKELSLTQTVTTIRYTNEDATVISDGQGHYLNLSNGNISVGNSAETATKWRFGTGNTKTIFTQVGDNTYYLRSNSNTLTVTTTANSATAWTFSNNRISYNNYYLTYNNGGWTLSNVTTYYLIHDGNGHYLNAAANAFSTGTVESEATKWTFSAPNGSGTISTKIGSTTYYLRNYNNGTLQVSSTTSTNWTSSANAIYNGNYYLSIDSNNNWGLTTNDSGTLIGDGRGNYLSLPSATPANGAAVGNADNAGEATIWTIANTGVIYTQSGGYYYYLRNSGGSLNLYRSNSLSTTSNNNRTPWTVANGRISNNNYYIVCTNGTWSLSTLPVGSTTSYIFSDGNGHYLNYVGTPNAYSVGVGDSEESATLWIYDNAGPYYVPSTAPTRHLTYYNGNPVIAPTNTGSGFYYYTYSNGYLSTSNGYYVQYNGSSWTAVNNRNNATPITRTERTVTPIVDLTLVDKSTIVSTTVRHTQHNYDYTLTLTDTTFENWKETSVQNNVPVDTEDTTLNASVFPLAYTEDGAVNRNKNTGYVMGGSDRLSSDLRVSRYDMSKISVALGGNQSYNPAKLEIITRTATSNGYALIKDEDNYNYQNSTASGYSNITAVTSNRRDTAYNLGLKKYTSARDQLEDLFNPENANGVRVASSNIYGLHFMNLTENTSIGDNTHRVTVPTAWINGTRYTDYVMPTNCIDFNLKQRGSINFFAGSYYTNNNSFFALYKVVRGNDGSLQSVIEIEKIYGNPTNDLAPVYYKLSGQSRYTTDGKTFLTDEQWAALPSTSKEPLFDMDWVTMSNGNTIVNNAVYYFEIPVNEGEYALGCVTGDKTGAYLMYLDIGASETAISYRDGAAGSALGTIDYVYHNSGDVITVTTVPDVLPQDEDYQYYYASLCMMGSQNDYQEQPGDPFFNINQAKIYVRRTIDAVDDRNIPVMHFDIRCADEKYFRTVPYSALADPIVRTNAAYSP